LDPHIFRAYDIRGVLDVDIDEDVAYAVGRGYASTRKAAGGPGMRFLFGRDNRPSSEGLAEAAMRGAVSAGADVVDGGMIMTPMLYYGVASGAFDGGLMVTGSHNPPEYNGFKMVEGDGVPISSAEIQDVRKLIEQDSFASGDGSIARGYETELVAAYMKEVASRVQLRGSHRVVVDAGNAIPGKFVPPLLRTIGCEVTELFCELDGTFPNHLPDPEMAENMEDLRRRVGEIDADVGLGFDGDGDRVGIVDDLAQHHEADLLLLLLSRRFLRRHPGEKVLLDVKCSLAVSEGIEALGGEPVLTATGHALIKRRMREEGVLLGGEVSGHMFIGDDWYGVDDALLSSCHLLELIDSEGMTISQLLADVPEYPSTPELKLACPDSVKFDVVEEIVSHFGQMYPDSLTLDGIRIVTEDGWALVRASNTNPYLTVRVEGRTQPGFDRLRLMVGNKLLEYDSVDVVPSLLE